jgi:hypothetical protein
MKRYTYLLFIFGMHLYGFGQGNLQFNQVKIISNIDPPQTVPAGKVWKIESVFSDAASDTYPVDGSGSTQNFFASCGMGAFYFHYYGRYLAINSIPVSFGIHSAGEQMTNLPIWVPAGATICTCTSPTYCARGYSAIEFNIVP